MYTQGITKILLPNKALEIGELQKLAVSLGYSAVCYKGDIYVAISDELWTKTVFRLSDFVGQK